MAHETFIALSIHPNGKILMTKPKDTLADANKALVQAKRKETLKNKAKTKGA